MQKEGKTIPITALDKYGKTIQKCQKVLSDYPESKFRTDAFLLMAKSKFYRKDYDLAIDDYHEGISTDINNICVPNANGKKEMHKQGLMN